MRTAFCHITCSLLVSVYMFMKSPPHFLLLIRLPALLLSSFPTAAPSPQAPTTPPAGCLTCVQTRSSASTAMTTSSVASPPWLSHAPAACCWLVMMTLTATSGMPWRETEQVGGWGNTQLCAGVMKLKWGLYWLEILYWDLFRFFVAICNFLSPPLIFVQFTHFTIS